MYRCEAYHFFKYEGNHLANMPSNVVSVTAGECGQVIYAYITSANTQRGGKYIFTQTSCALLWVLLVPVWYACAPMLITRGKRNREEAPASLPCLVGSTHFAKIPSGVLCFTGRLYHFLPHSQALPSWPVSPGAHCGGTSSCLAFAAGAAALTPVLEEVVPLTDTAVLSQFVRETLLFLSLCEPHLNLNFLFSLL